MIEEQVARGVQMLTVNEAAALLGISRRQIYRLITSRAVPHVRLGGCVRFEKSVLEAWIRQQMLRGVADAYPTTRDEMDGRPAAPRFGGGLVPIPPVPW